MITRDTNIPLLNWSPMYLLDDVADRGGQVIEADYWNAQWNLHKTQGDYTTRTMETLLDTLQDSIWATPDGLLQIAYPDYSVEKLGGETASSNLRYAVEGVSDLSPILGEDGAAHISDSSFNTLLRPTDPALTDTQLPTILAYLRNLDVLTNIRVDDISAAKLDAFKHNDIGQRDAADAHPASAITYGVITVHAGIDAAIKAASDAQLSAGSVASSLQQHEAAGPDRHVAASVSATFAKETVNVQSALNTIYNTLLNISGDYDKIVIDHNDVFKRDAANAHPLESISVPSTLVGDVGNAVDLCKELLSQIASKQSQITAGTDLPDSAMGNVGDVYIQYL